ncbi:hypothetical protein PR202_gb06784 [Eleusine coracana subsp. coracana]|uniref:Uncharacterized protein n=1 Tax=Eleusine coracana subsp. coracana TaxID=191504 RepID=A0AAV5E9P2_ELECO|nr:hypothetical protein QOZ80_2BG0161900 [Eleusine coracana subsp. coracana]GJN19502.1 hypothetical protein PR202_gb06784 [Eleusine coracana subsp. coracana]
MSWSQAVPPPPLGAAAAYGGRMKKRAGLPKLLHKLFVKVLRLRPPPAEPSMTTMGTAFYGCRMGPSDEEYCYYYGFGAGPSSWAGVLSSIPEAEEVVDGSDEGSPDAVDVADPAAVLRKTKTERFVVGPPEAATVVHVEVLL